MYSYMFSYDSSSVAHREVLDFFKQSEMVVAWASPFLGTVVVISSFSAEDLSDNFAVTFNAVDHLFVDIQDDEADYQGWLDDDVWDYINNPEEYS